MTKKRIFLGANAAEAVDSITTIEILFATKRNISFLYCVVFCLRWVDHFFLLSSRGIGRWRYSEKMRRILSQLSVRSYCVCQRLILFPRLCVRSFAERICVFWSKSKSDSFSIVHSIPFSKQILNWDNWQNSYWNKYENRHLNKKKISHLLSINSPPIWDIHSFINI